MQELSLEKIETNIARRQNTISQYIVNHPILELCMAGEQHPGERVPNQFW